MTEDKALVEAGRAQFEARFIEADCDTGLERIGEDYLDAETSAMWRAWNWRTSECAGLRAELEAERAIKEAEKKILLKEVEANIQLRERVEELERTLEKFRDRGIIGA